MEIQKASFNRGENLVAAKKIENQVRSPEKTGKKKILKGSTKLTGTKLMFNR